MGSNFDFSSENPDVLRGRAEEYIYLSLLYYFGHDFSIMPGFYVIVRLRSSEGTVDVY